MDFLGLGFDKEIYRMDNQLVVLKEKPVSQYLIAGWRRQWSDGGSISSGLPRYLIDKLNAREIGQFGEEVSRQCYPFQVPGTHDAYRPRVAYQDGLPTQDMFRRNYFYDAGNGLIIFLGDSELASRDLLDQAVFPAGKRAHDGTARELGLQDVVLTDTHDPLQVVGHSQITGEPGERRYRTSRLLVGPVMGQSDPYARLDTGAEAATGDRFAGFEVGARLG